ncbi:copper homeostasis protein CutC [Chryseobacterium fluminis]|uniref:copper homeostasis protein CutC n=1 Tax=Chryseobacterium fluminis TaxID=2983606 RepID=UPI002B1CC46E
MSKIEIACFNPESAIIASENGADRIELCDGLSEGGTTPDFETAKLSLIIESSIGTGFSLFSKI